MTARVVVVAWDGADSLLCDQWSLDGALPTLARLRREGRARHVAAPPGITDDGLWASFQYESGLGEHGRYHWAQPQPPKGHFDLSHKMETGRTRIWDRLSAAGSRIAVLDIPKCAAPRAINGVHVSDWEVHGRYSLTPQSYPPGLAEEIVATFGPAPPSSCGEEQPALGDADAKVMVGHLLTGIAQKEAAATSLLAREPWDVFLVGFKEAHCAGHALWDIADQRSADYDGERDKRLGRPMLQVMQALDRALASICDAAGPGAEVVVFSTTRYVSNGTLEHLVQPLLRRMAQHLRGGPLSAVRWTWQRRGIDLLRYNENCTALRVRGAGREELIDEVERLAGEFVDEETGAPAVARIDRPSQTFKGQRSAQLPDLLLHAPPGRMPSTIVSPTLGRIKADRPIHRPGNHESGLFVVSAGPRASLGEAPDSIEAFGRWIEQLQGERRPAGAQA